ncbi:MAG: hypothetical protein LBP99_03470 [Azoarcus sp.]|jgi:hypothetical protein|nr:hypothetical protein [Azoarcus sp.]
MSSIISVHTRQHTVLLRLVGFLAIFMAIVAALWWGLDMGQAPAPKQMSTPDESSSVRLPPGMSDPANDVDVSVENNVPVKPADPAPAVLQDRISSLLAQNQARAVYSGKKSLEVEFLTKEGAVSDTYSESALSREGWKLSVSSDKQVAVLRKGESVHNIPIVYHSSPGKNKQTSKRKRWKGSNYSNIKSTGDHEDVGYLKQKRRGTKK